MSEEQDDRFKCPKCKKIKEWYEFPICDTCGYDEEKKQ